MVFSDLVPPKKVEVIRNIVRLKAGRSLRVAEFKIYHENGLDARRRR